MPENVTDHLYWLAKPFQYGKICKVLIYLIFMLPYWTGQLQAQSSSQNILTSEALSISEDISINGLLDEPERNRTPAISGFSQVEPNQGEPARYDTEVRVLYNDDYIYIGARPYDEPGQQPRVATLSRNFSYFQNDLFGVVFDTFNNERDAISFQVTPYSNQSDLQVFDDAITNQDYDVVWYAETQITSDGWTVEMAIPWSSIRYSEENDTWGINFIRRHRRSNEETAWAPWPRAYSTFTRNQFRDLGVESTHRDIDLVNITFRLALNPRLQLAGSLQHYTNQRLNLVNLRFSWEFLPLSYLYLVFNDVHPFGDDLDLRPSGLQQANFKLTYLEHL